jgi:uncharacterized protein YjlB
MINCVVYFIPSEQTNVMNRKRFLSLGSAFFGTAHWIKASFTSPQPDLHYFKDDGIVPNSKYPLLHYRNVFDKRGDEGALWLEEKFLSNNWSNSWRNGVFTFQHYHSIAHEVLGFYNGKVSVLLGGDSGKIVKVTAGDIIVIPAGVGHKNLGDDKLGVVGAYPNGMPVDILRAEPGDRPKADKNIAGVPFPDTDPLLGNSGGLIKIWNRN